MIIFWVLAANITALNKKTRAFTYVKFPPFLSINFTRSALFMKNSSFLIHPEELSYKWIDRMVSCSVKTLALHPVGGWRAPQSLAAMLALLREEDYRHMLDYAHEMGMRIEYEMHAARYLMPVAEFENHPEYFRMTRDGQRSADVNFCPSSMEALTLFCENAAHLAGSLYRSTDRFFIWLDDAEDGKCHCPACRGMSASDQQMKILNAVAKRIREDIPRASVAYLAYLSCIAPPSSVERGEGVFLEYAPIKRDHHLPLREGGVRENIEALMEYFGAEGAKALDYWFDNSLFSSWKKPPVRFEADEKTLVSDMAFYRELGFEDIGTFACYLGADYELLYGEADITPFKRALCRE
jgi:hypothetical protein